MIPAPAHSRGQRLARLHRETFDLLVVGGGATGAAVARDAAWRGLRVALCEQDDFAAHTSSQSSKLIHGGLRYLQYGDLPLVFEGLRERRILMKTAPHLCWPTDFLFPIYRDGGPGLWTLGAGIAIYNALGLWRPPARHAKIDPAQLWRQHPQLRTAGLQGAHLYGDCQTDDARLVLENVLDAEAGGAICVNYAQVTGPLLTRAGNWCGATIRDRLGGETLDLRCHVIVNATGPFSDRVRYAFTDEGPPRLRPTVGVHLVLDSARLPTHNRALVLRTAGDGRLYFVLPAGPRTIVGTTDTDWPGGKDTPPDPDSPVAAKTADVRYLLQALAHDFPAAHIGPDDVIATFAGLRPLVAQDSANTSAISREHGIFLERPGLLTIAGGKLTTLRSMAEEIVDRVIEQCGARGFAPQVGPCLTRTRPLPGAQTPGGPPMGDNAPSTAPALPEAIQNHLNRRYGSRATLVATLATQSPTLAAPLAPALPDLVAEVVHAVRHEHAQTPMDVLRRRMPVFLYDRDHGLAKLPLVRDLMAAELGWTGGIKQRMEDQYRGEVARVRGWCDRGLP